MISISMLLISTNAASEARPPPTAAKGRTYLGSVANNQRLRIGLEDEALYPLGVHNLRPYLIT
jgi:hypothetical protein